MNAELSPAGGPVFRIYRARPADVADLHGLVRALADHERLGGLCTSTPDDLADALFGRLPAAEALIAILMGILSFMSDFVGFGLFFILTRHSSAAGASGSKMFSCGRSTVVSGSCGNCSRRLRVSPASGAATASNGPCSTGMSGRSPSMNRSGERCCRTGRSRALPSRRSRASPNHPGGGSPARTRVSRRLGSLSASDGSARAAGDRLDEIDDRCPRGLDPVVELGIQVIPLARLERERDRSQRGAARPVQRRPL